MKTTFRMFAACRDGDCGDCIGETLASVRRDGEPAIGAETVREKCGCDCHAHDECEAGAR